jgi:hypothetical protein
VIPNCNFLRNLAEYVTSILKVFGTIPESSHIGFPAEASEYIFYFVTEFYFFFLLGVLITKRSLLCRI